MQLELIIIDGHTTTLEKCEYRAYIYALGFGLTKVM
jgi:hypothetical protein